MNIKRLDESLTKKEGTLSTKKPGVISGTSKNEPSEPLTNLKKIKE